MTEKLKSSDYWEGYRDGIGFCIEKFKVMLDAQSAAFEARLYIAEFLNKVQEKPDKE